MVFGIGSYTYQHVTRDSFGTAIKATFGVVGGEDRVLFKAPKTDNGTKNSARGLLRVEREAAASCCTSCRRASRKRRACCRPCSRTAGWCAWRAWTPCDAGSGRPPRRGDLAGAVDGGKDSRCRRRVRPRPSVPRPPLPDGVGRPPRRRTCASGHRVPAGTCSALFSLTSTLASWFSASTTDRCAKPGPSGIQVAAVPTSGRGSGTPSTSQR